LALIEAKIIVAEFVRTFDFELEKGFKLTMNIGANYEPNPPLKVNITPK